MLSWFLKRWLAPKAAQTTEPHSKRRRKKGRGLMLEILEDRLAPATFNVNSFVDTDAVNLSTGQDQAGSITLRSAIEAANHVGGSNTINLVPGTYSLVSHFNAAGSL